MARTRQQWEAIVATAPAFAELSASASAEWLFFRDVAITIAMVLEAIYELFKTDNDYTLANKHPLTPPQWPVMIKEFQYGDSLISDNGVYKYETINEENQIVTQASINEADDGHLYVKVAKDDGGGNNVQLSTAEQTDLNNYIKVKRPPGVQYTLQSLPADVIKYTLTVKYLNQYNKDTVEAEIEAALVELRDSLPFDAEFVKSKLIDTVHNVDGVHSVLATIDMTLDDGNEIVTNLEELKVLPAGYYNWDETSSITMIAA